MSAQAPVALRRGVHTLQAAMMMQILLGLTRFGAPFFGWNLPDLVWRAHPVLGVLIAVAVAIVLRPRPGAVPTMLRRSARFAPLAPLTLGVAIALGARLGPALVPLHMVVGLGALGVVDNALKQLIAAVPPAGQRLLPPPVRA